jgi:hypothetical protein
MIEIEWHSFGLGSTMWPSYRPSRGPEGKDIRFVSNMDLKALVSFPSFVCFTAHQPWLPAFNGIGTGIGSVTHL